MSNGEKKYLRMFVGSGFNTGRSGIDLVSEADRSLFSVDVVNNRLRIHTTISGKEHYWVRNITSKTALVGYQSDTDITMAWLTLP